MKKNSKPNKLFFNCNFKNASECLGSNKGLLIIVVFLALIGLLLFKKIYRESEINRFKKTIIPTAVKKLLNSPSTKFEVSKIKDTNGIYEFELTINSSQKYTSFITKDGKVLFTSGIKLDTLDKPVTQGTTTPEKKLTCNDLQKTKTPTLTAFVVADCPYGLQMQRVFKKAIDEQSQLMIYLNVKYIGNVENGKITSMHGDKEAQENLRQICIREEQKDLYWYYVSCYMHEGKSEECLNSSNINTDQLKSCIDDPNRGLKFAKADFDLANKYGIGSSPTLLLNEKQKVSEFNFGGRVPDALKQIVCCGSINKSEFCNNKLSTDTVASSFSLTDEQATTNAGSNANCGTQ